MTFRSLSEFTKQLRTLPRRVAERVAEEVAPELTTVAHSTFLASEDAYGVPWAPRADGRKATLRKKGDLFDFLHYVAIGTKLRVALGVRYAKYQIGRRPVFPTQGGALPSSYIRTLQRVSVRVCREEHSR